MLASSSRLFIAVPPRLRHAADGGGVRGPDVLKHHGEASGALRVRDGHGGVPREARVVDSQRKEGGGAAKLLPHRWPQRASPGAESTKPLVDPREDREEATVEEEDEGGVSDDALHDDAGSALLVREGKEGEADAP